VIITRFTKVLTLASVVLAGYPGAARAQLFFSPNPVAFTIPTPGSAAGPITVNVSSPTPISAVTIAGVTTTDGTNWLCALPNSFNSVNVFIGTGGCSNTITSQLATNGSYSGQVTVQGNGGALIGMFSVTLQVGSGSGATGLAANPISVSFTENVPGQASPTSQTISATFNGAAIAITGANFTPNQGSVPAFINTTFNNGSVILTVNSLVTAAGIYQGTETLVTSSGNINVPVTLTFGSGGSNLTATPNPVNFNVQTGGNAAPQNVTITLNGAPVAINSVSASSGATWLLPSLQSLAAGNVNVSVNAAGLSAGIYNGIVTVVTPQGQVSFQVNLTVAGIATLNVNPTALNFAYQIGTNNPLPQTISVTSNGTPVNFNVSPTTSSGGGQWLVVNPTGSGGNTPSLLTVSVNPTGLAPGFTYQGNIQINTFGASTNPVVNIPISLLVSINPILAANPASLSFTAQAGGVAATQNLQLSSSSTQLNYTVTSNVTSPSGSLWLQVPTQIGATPGAVNVSVNTQGLAPGTYNGTITATSQSAGNAAVTVPVTLTITAGAALQLNPASVSFAYQIGQAQPVSQAVTVSSNSGQLNYTLTTQTNSGQPWLNISTNSGATPGNFTIGVNTAGLTPGTYDGSVSVTPSNNPAQTIPVRLVVSNTALLVVSPGSLVFSIPAGSGGSSFQNLAVTSTDGTPISFNVNASTSTGSSWLLASSSFGTTASNLTFSANPNGLAIGTYSGTITITATTPNVADSPQTIAVTLNITPTATLTASATSLSFTQAINGSPPASQTLAVSSVGAPITFAANVTLFQGLNWLTVSPTNATATPSSPTTLTVTANGSGLGAGTYNGQIALTSPGAASALVVNVTLTISNAQTITISPASLTPVSFQIGGPNPAPQTIAVSIAGGAAVAFNASATTASGGNWLFVAPATGTTFGNVVVSVNPAGLPAGTYQGTVSITVAGATNSPITLPIALTVSPAAVVGPTVTGIQNAASSVPTSLAPGLNIVIYGLNMGPATLVTYQVGANGALLTTLTGTQVTFDGIPAAIIYTSSLQVSVMVPYEIAGRISSAMVVSYNGVPSTPLQLRVTDSAPGIYSANSTGSGQGSILNENFSVNSPANPEATGHYIQIYGTGEGQTSPQGSDGLITSTQRVLPLPNLPVAVTIGGLSIPTSDIAYAGEAPLNVSGVIQVNAKIPAGVGPGPVPVVMIVGGVPSQANLTVSVR
jgi:uncharacterized protein (TIGR03437 family)